MDERIETTCLMCKYHTEEECAECKKARKTAKKLGDTRRTIIVEEEDED